MKRQQGFTLLELLVAFAIMALSLGMLYRASGSGARSVVDIEHYQRAVILGESLLALRDAVPEQGWNQTGESAGYNWRISSAPYATAITGPNVPPLHEISIVITWADADRQRQFTLNTLRPQRKPPEPGRNP
ncbi:UNVERIFIED_CONTAM: general secretion pathway protein I [Acidovorax defluvii]